MKRLPRVLSPQEARRLLAACLTDRERAIIGLGLYAGLRRDEMRNVQWEDVDFEQGQVLVRKAKGGKQRYVPLHPELAALLRLVTKADRWLLAGRAGGQIANRTIQQTVTDVAGRARLRGHVHTHSLRHSFATAVYGATGDLLAVRDLLGHESVRTTEIYTHLAVGRLRGAVESFSLKG